MQQKFSYSQIFIYGLPGLPLAMLGLPLFVYLPSFYSQDLGLSLSAVGLALLLARSFDVITDPLIGLLNDRYPRFKSVIWRRKSYIIIGVPLLLIGLNFLLKPTADATAFYLFAWSFVTYLGWTLINIPWHALGAEISQDYHEKSALASSREIFSVIGTVTVVSIPILLSIQSDLKLTLETLANLLTVLLPIALIPLLWKLKLWKTPGDTVSTPKVIEPSFSKTRLFNKKLLSVLKHPAIKKLLPSYFLNSIANALPATLFILFVTHIIQAPEKISVLLSAYFLSAIAGIPLWLYLSRKTDKHISWCIALLGSIASFIWVPFIGVGDLIPFLMVCLASGFCLGADVVMPASIQADISQHISKNPEDKFEGKNLQESTALLFGIWGLLTKLSLALAIGIAFPLLDLVNLQLDAATKQVSSDMAILTLIILYALIPIILKLWVLFQMWHFPFDKRFFTNVTSTEINTFKGNENENIQTKAIDRPIPFISIAKRVQ